MAQPTAPPSSPLISVPGQAPPPSPEPPPAQAPPPPLLAPKTPPGVRISLVVLAVLGVIGFCYLAREILVPLVLGVFLSYVLSPLVAWLRHRLNLPRPAAVAVVVVLTGVVLGLVAYAMVAEVVAFTRDWAHYSAKVAQLAGQLAAPISRWQEEFRHLIPGSAKGPRPQPVEIVGSQLEFLPPILVRVGSIMSILGDAVLVLFMVIFALAEEARFRQRLLEFAGPSQADTASRVLDGINKGIMGYLWGTLLVALVVFVGTAAILWPFVAYPIVWGLLAAVLTLIPYLGAIVAIIPPVVLASLNPSHHSQVIWILSLYTTFRVIEGNFITPAMLGHLTDVNPFAVIVSLMFWGWLWGPIGLILGVPLTVAIIVICDHVPGWLVVGTFLGGSRRARIRILTPAQVQVQQNLAEQTRALEIEATQAAETAVTGGH